VKKFLLTQIFGLDRLHFAEAPPTFAAISNYTPGHATHISADFFRSEDFAHEPENPGFSGDT
jgi:hypothetical protein